MSVLILRLALLPVGAIEASDDFVSVHAGGFTCDGQPFPVVGFNCYYLMVFAAEPGLRRHVDEVLEEARAMGSTVVRTWAFNDGADQWNALQTSPGDYSERVLVGLDYVVQKARTEGLRLILTFVNNWDDYGGMNQYVSWSSTAAEHDDFYSDSQTREWYRDHATHILTRENSFTGVAYKADPTIFAWELANEPRSRSTGAAVLTEWIASMASHVKSIDSRHLLTTGSEGFYAPSGPAHNPAGWMGREGVDFIGQHSIADIDFASFHTWPESWALSRAQAVAWVRDHLADAREFLDKPVLMGEFGHRQPVATRDAFFFDYYSAIIDSIEPGTSSAGSLCWILYHDDYPDFDGYGVYFPDPAHSTTVALLAEQHRRVKAKVASAGPSFVRADFNCDRRVDISDAVGVLGWLFRSLASSCCADAGDSNDDGVIDVSDALYILGYLFGGSEAPPAPFPACGVDGAAEEPDLGCVGYLGCG